MVCRRSSLGDDSDRRVEADAELRDREVVVDGLGHADCAESGFVQCGGDAQRVVAADRHERVDAVVPKRLDDPVDAVLLLQRIRPRGAEDGASLREDAAYVGRLELVDEAFAKTARPAVLDATDLVPELKRTTSHRPDGGVEPGRVSASGENSDPHREIG